jgi:hypothetical protein
VAALHLGGLPWLRSCNAGLSACSQGWDSPGEGLAGVLAGGDGDSILERRSSRWGCHLGAHPCCTGFSR